MDLARIVHLLMGVCYRGAKKEVLRIVLGTSVLDAWYYFSILSQEVFKRLKFNIIIFVGENTNFLVGFEN